MQSMLRTLASAALALGITGSLSAQIICYESQIGSSIGIGDDTVLPIQSLGFAFPFNGGTFTDVHAVTNGFVYLSNAGVPAPGGSLCCTGSTASLVAGSPKICPRLDDLNILAANSAGVYFNAMPGKAVVTWVNAVEFSNTVPFTMQLQLFATGEIVMFYSPNVTARTAGDALVGFSPGNGAVVPTASDLSVAGNSTVNTIFQIFNNGGTANWDLGGTSVLFVPNGAGYTWLNLPCAAFHETYGAGCYDRGGSVYENFSGSGSFDLSGQTLTAVPAGGGYFWNTAPVGTLFPGATNLNLTDDSLSAAIPLNTPFPYQGGTATQIIVCSNGRIFLSGTGNATYLTSVAAYLSDDPSVGMWFDFNPTAGGQVQADFDAANNQEVVTWNGVFAFGTTSANTVQIVLSLQGSAVPGQVEFRFQTFTNNSSTNTSQAIVGFSHGHTVTDPGSTDFSTAVPFVSGDEIRALALNANPIPLLGSAVTYTVSNIPANALISGLLLSLGQIAPPGFDMTAFGAPGCWQHIDLSTSSSSLLFGTPTASRVINMPNSPSFQGFNLYSQGASLVPGINALQAITSNGLRSQLF